MRPFRPCHALLPALWLACMACGRSEAGVVELRYMAWGNPQQLALEQRLCDEFSAANPRIKVRLFRVPGSAYGNKMIVMLASRTAPDVMRVDHYVFPSLVKKDYFRRLDDLIEGDPEFRIDDFFPQAVDEGRHAGGLYGLNVLFGAIIVYYNKTMVRQAGLEDPFELWKRGEWTWDRFVAHAKAMTRKGEDGRYKAFGSAIPSFPGTIPPVWAMGGEMLDPTHKRVLLGSGRAVEGWRFWRDLRYVHDASPTPAQAANSVFSFESGKLGMAFDWMGMTPRFREAATGFYWDVVPVPKGPAGGSSTLKGNQLVMNADTAHPREAWEFMKYMTSEKVERLLYVEMRRSFPTRKKIAYSKEYLESNLPPFNMRTFTFSVENGRPLPITDRWSDWTGAFNSGMDNLMNGRTASVEAACADAQERAQRALDVQEGL